MSSVRSVYVGALQTLIARRTELIQEMEDINAQIILVRQEAELAGVDLCAKV